jgi:hypothetical protein
MYRNRFDVKNMNKSNNKNKDYSEINMRYREDICIGSNNIRCLRI